jgi:flagellar hook-basal body complex protein FliE
MQKRADPAPGHGKADEHSGKNEGQTTENCHLTPFADRFATRLRPRLGEAFTKVVNELLSHANGQQVSADNVLQDFALGKTDNLHSVMLAVAKADLSFRLFLEIRNRLTDAYQEIMRSWWRRTLALLRTRRTKSKIGERTSRTSADVIQLRAATFGIMSFL